MEESPRFSRTWGIAIFVAVTLIGVGAVFWFVRAHQNPAPDMIVSQPETVPRPVMSTVPTVPTPTPTPTPTEWQEDNAPTAKKVAKTYLESVNTWDATTDPDEWRDDVLTLVSPTASRVDTLAWLTTPMIEECAAAKCVHSATAEFVEEEAPSDGNNFAGYYRVKKTTEGDNQETVTTIWFVETTLSEPPLVVDAIDLETDEVPRD